ncbi:MAG: hypothetical protein AB7E37_08120, partial [Candidatus Altimarinota bacterium]
MAQNILDIIEQTLVNLAQKYKSFTEQEDLKHSDIKDYDTELNDIMERYKTLKSLQSVISVEDLQILYNEYNTIFQDFKSKYESGYFIGKDGLNGTFENLTQEQKDSLKGEKGDKGEDGLNGTFENLTQEQKDSLKGEKGDKGEDGSNGTFEDLTQEQKDSLKGEKGDKGEDGLNGTFEDLTQEQKNILFEEFKVSINLSSILTRLQTLENSSSTPAIMEKTLTYKQSEEGYNILTNFVPNEGETGFFVINLSA